MLGTIPNSLHKLMPNNDIKPLTLGIIGAAGIARPFTAELLGNEFVRIDAVASRSEETARAFAESCGIPRHHGTYQALLDDPAIEAVYVPLPNHLHAEWAIKAAERGKHILCEKPLCMGRAEADAMF
ncbi:MAG: Gfo/Idh/MocA family oxidoreductase, partial [Betaproteobacteria bacterium]